MLSSVTLLLLGALSRDPSLQSSSVTDPPQRWAGHQVNYGTRQIPFRGEVTTRTDTFLLASAKFDGRRLVLHQEACLIRFQDVGRVRVSMDASSLPPTRMTFSLQDDDQTLTGRSSVIWGEEDIDHDGNPGMTVTVDAPVCSGDLYVSNRSRTLATGFFDPQGFHGTAKVRVEQTILGSRGRCLGVVARDSDELVSGPFAYTRVATGTTCASLLRTRWPIDAEA